MNSGEAMTRVSAMKMRLRGPLAVLGATDSTADWICPSVAGDSAPAASTWLISATRAAALAVAASGVSVP